MCDRNQLSIKKCQNEATETDGQVEPPKNYVSHYSLNSFEKGMQQNQELSIGQQQGRDHPYEGECIDDIAQRSGERFSHTNLMRIAFKLLWALETLHQQGFCHRDVHCGNVLLRREFDGIVRLKIIDFALSLPLNPPPMPELNLTSWHASLPVWWGEAYTRFDDFTSAIFLLLWFVPVNPFGDVRTEYLVKKEKFDENPHVWFNDEVEWIPNLYTSIQLQRTSGYSHTDLFNVMYKFDPNFDPTSPIAYRVVDNQLTIE
ncbi:Protein CBG02005 [Caenorhabditis briggsae]|uniref:Protein CBG02005 n=1 Tax=Caenorhabditis briggsae TaxID=6238 RepID=A8WRS5_CAEBR|nr:Protein CBG02005 [Caenorhabditis briggsae]CAP23183.2 Protein CBG02005 [Caenorhabditis briggsae]